MGDQVPVPTLTEGEEVKDSQFFQELVLRAPACPESFHPKMETAFPELDNRYPGGIGIQHRLWMDKEAEQKLAQWPSFYAREVMKAAGLVESQENRTVTNIPIIQTCERCGKLLSDNSHALCK